MRRKVPSYFSTTVGETDAGYSDSSNYEYGSGLRFTNINIPLGATITSANVTFTARVQNHANVYSTLSANDSDSTVTFSTSATDFDSNYSCHTATTVNWDSSVTWLVNSTYTSPDISGVLQVVVNRSGWVSGNSIIIYWDDFANRSYLYDGYSAYAYDSDSAKVPVLKANWQYTPPPSEYWGKTDVGADYTSYTTDYILASYQVSPIDCGTITRISFYTRSAAGAYISLKAFIYSYHLQGGYGAPDAVLATSNEVTGVDNSLQWVNFTISYTVSPNTEYWFAIMANDTYGLRKDAGQERVDQNGQTYSTAPNPWGATVNYHSDNVSIYATYTPISDSTPPTYSNSTFGTNNTYAGQPTLFYGNWSDIEGVSGFILETNNTGVVTNQTWTAIVGTYWSNKTLTLNSTVGVVIQWKVYANDTSTYPSNNWNSTGYFYLTTNTSNVAPTLGQFSVPTTVYAYQNVNVSIVANDGNGKSDLHNVTLSFNVTSVDLVWTEATNATSKTDSNNYFNLVASYIAELNSTSYNVTWTVQIYWNSTKGLYGLDANTMVYDDSDSSATCTSGQFTFVDDLVVASGLTVNCTRCNPSGTAKFSGQLYYQGTSIAPYTTINITVYAELNGTMKGSNSSISNDGSFQVTITSEASPLGTYTYNLYSLTDEISTTNRTASLIVDRVVVTITISDDRIDVSVNATITISGIYQTDSTSMTGSFTMNDTTYLHGTVGRWNFTVQSITDATYGLTTFTSNSVYCIWDKALIQSGGISLSYSHVGDSVQVYYVVKYEYDLSLITDGNVFLNGSAMTYNPAVTKWERTVSSAVLGNQSWIITAINSNTYGITVIDDTVGAESCLYYANLNTRTVDVDSNPLTQAIVYMNNGTTGIPGGLPIGGGYAIVGSMSWSYQTVSSTGWANWTGLTNDTLQIYVKWYGLTVNNTFTLNITTDMNLDVTCLCYPFNVSATMYWAASNATVTSKLYVANILTLHFSSPMNTYQLVSSCIYQPKYITNITYDYSSDFMLGYLALPHYGNATLKLGYEGWGDLYVQKTDKPISAASLIGTNLTISLMGNLGEIGNVQVYCGSRGGPAESGGFTTATFIGGLVNGLYSFPSSTADLWLSWAAPFTGPGYESNLPTSLSVILTLTFPNSAQPGQTLIGTLNVTWKGFPTIYLWSMMCEGTYTNWFLALPEGLPKSLSTSNQTVSLLTQLKIPVGAVLGQTQVPCSLTFATGQGNTKVFHVLVTLNLASPANVPDVLTFIFLGLIGSVIAVGLFAGERRRRKKASSSRVA
jgi:hypothetical protein